MKLLLATRPAFLSITLLGVLLGLAHAMSKGAQPGAVPALLIALGALLAHAAANVINDVYDAQNGSDACNTDRVSPFTGGSRFIQDQTLSLSTMRTLGWALLACSALTGVLLIGFSDARLLYFGLGGLALAALYSLPPVQLMSRGLGEMAVGGAWILLIAGSDFVIRQTIDAGILWVATPFAIHVMLILLVNQIPDYAADLAAGKRNWVVRWGKSRAVTLYTGLLIAGHSLLVLGIVADQLPASAAACLLSLPIGLFAASALTKHREHPPRLRRPIVLTLISAHLCGLALLASLIAIY